MPIATAHIAIYGHVQGIGFRHFTKETADDLGICGSVENRSDGDVEVIAVGEREVLERFIKLIEKGNGYSIIEKVHVKWKEGGHATGEFKIIQTSLW